MNNIPPEVELMLRKLFGDGVGVRAAARRLQIHRDTVMRKYRTYKEHDVQKDTSAIPSVDTVIRTALKEAKREAYEQGWRDAVKAQAAWLQKAMKE